MDKLRRSFRSSFRKRSREDESQSRSSWPMDEASVKNNTCSFEVKYLGSVEVFESRGMQVCEEAIKLLKSSRRPPIRGLLHVSGDGLRVSDSATKGLVLDQTIEKVSFCAPDRNFEKGFSYICRDGATRRWMCHGFMAVGVSGERISHAVGCAFAICLDRKQRREKECAVQYHYNNKENTFTRFGSFRQGATISERLQDPQSFKPAEPPPSAQETSASTEYSDPFGGNPHMVARPRASELMYLRQASYRGLGKLSGSSPFKRNYSLRLDQLPSTLARQQMDQQQPSSLARQNLPSSLARHQQPSTNQNREQILSSEDLAQQSNLGCASNIGLQSRSGSKSPSLVAFDGCSSVMADKDDLHNNRPSSTASGYGDIVSPTPSNSGHQYDSSLDSRDGHASMSSSLVSNDRRIGQMAQQQQHEMPQVVPRNRGQEFAARRSQIFSLPSGIPSSSGHFSPIRELSQDQDDFQSIDLQFSSQAFRGQSPAASYTPVGTSSNQQPTVATATSNIDLLTANLQSTHIHGSSTITANGNGTRSRDPFALLDAVDSDPLSSLPPPLIGDVSAAPGAGIDSRNSLSPPPPPLPPRFSPQQPPPSLPPHPQTSMSPLTTDQQQDRDTLQVHSPLDSEAELRCETRASVSSNPWDNVPDQPSIRIGSIPSTRKVDSMGNSFTGQLTSLGEAQFNTQALTDSNRWVNLESEWPTSSNNNMISSNNLINSQGNEFASSTSASNRGALPGQAALNADRQHLESSNAHNGARSIIASAAANILDDPFDAEWAMALANINTNNQAAGGVADALADDWPQQKDRCPQPPPNNSAWTDFSMEQIDSGTRDGDAMPGGDTRQDHDHDSHSFRIAL